MGGMTRSAFLTAVSLCAVSTIACRVELVSKDGDEGSKNSRLFTDGGATDPREPWPLPDIDGYPSMVILNNDQTFSANYFNVPEDLVADYVDEFKVFADEKGFDVSESNSDSIYGLSATWQVVDDVGHTDQREFRLNYNTNGQLTLTISRNSW